MISFCPPLAVGTICCAVGDVFIADKIAFAKISAVVANSWITNEVFVTSHDEVLSVAL